MPRLMRTIQPIGRPARCLEELRAKTILRHPCKYFAVLFMAEISNFDSMIQVSLDIRFTPAIPSLAAIGRFLKEGSRPRRINRLKSVWIFYRRRNHVTFDSPFHDADFSAYTRPP